MKKRNTKSSQAFRERNMAQRIAPGFPQEADQQAAHLGSQSAVPMQQGPDTGLEASSLGPTQDMSFGRTA